jgi:hypothetical protein
MKIEKILASFLGVFLVTSLFSSCGIYSFTGTGKVDESIKTIQIFNVTQQTAGGPSNLAQKFSENLKEYYQRNTRLKLTQVNPDVILEGQITAYEMTPVAPTVNAASQGGGFGNSPASDRGGLNRLTLSINIKYTNTKDENSSFDQTFSFFQDFPQNQTLSQVESSLIPKLIDQLILDIFNKSAGDW